MTKSSVQSFKPLLAVSMSALLAASVGCSAGGASSSNSNQAPNGSAAGEDKPFQITMMNQSIVAEPPHPDDPLIQAIEKYTNTKLDIQWVPSSTYDDKLNATIASGNLPMALLVLKRQESTINALRSGFFWEIGPYLKDYPNLQKAQNKQVADSLSLDGKSYSVFITVSPVLDSIIYRKDWLENLGLKPPQNLDDVYNMMKAFTLNDPDKNGKNDTVAFSEESGMRGFNFILAATGGGTEWDMKEGKLEPTIFSKEYMDTLNFYRKLYSEKLMNQDFAISTRQQIIDKMNQGQIGIRMGAPDQITRQTQLFKANPKADLDLTAALNGVKGTRAIMSAGYVGEFMFPKSSVKTEGDLRKVLAYFDKISDPGGQNIMEWGVEGVHYELQNSKATRTAAQVDKYNSQAVPVKKMLQVADGSLAMPGDTDPYIAKYVAAQKAVENNVVPNPAAKYISNTQLQKGADLQKMISDARIKYIMGDTDLNGWQSALNAWRKAGGDAVIQEMNEQYAKDPNKIAVK